MNLSVFEEGGLDILFIITEKTRVKEKKCDGVGVMKDKEVKLHDVKTPHTWVSYILLVKSLDIDSTEEVVILFEVDLQIPRNLSEHESVVYYESLFIMNR